MFVSEEEYMEKNILFHNKYKIYNDTGRYIHDKLINRKSKCIAFYIISACHSSSQRSKSLNSCFKGFGTLWFNEKFEYLSIDDLVR